MKHRLTILVVAAVLSIGFVDIADARRMYTQEKAASAIAHACEGLIVGYARNPSLRNELLRLYDTHVYSVMSMITHFVKTDVAEAYGIVQRAHIIAYARNPSLRAQLGQFADMCRDDIDDI